jgi:hypothetical protein
MVRHATGEGHRLTVMYYHPKLAWMNSIISMKTVKELYNTENILFYYVVSRTFKKYTMQIVGGTQSNKC